ncbi:hypothetical protein ZZ1p0060 [Acinetobacter phage ZZ1]|uniref:Uncharacterized protein n=2 Tax=Zedzedvirus zz1 TaxID=2843640 RepID=A0A410T577_9CAUD|nr:hypothetical protein ZZ1p0060 [Acinetobacter phage ZZ1]AFL47560.1 hypothetical protein ZZ1p0060 [Acinetobacter phage ZZ1]QAU03922.1 hypothetical protein Henu6_gp114 [Acinetobacter phage Henu6]
MDVLNQYVESKDQIQQIARNVYAILEANDPFGIIRLSDIKRLEIEPSKEDEHKVTLNLMNFEDVNPRVSFDIARHLTLAIDEDYIKQQWFDKCLQIIKQANFAKAKKFLKEFSSSDFMLIQAITESYEALAVRGKSDLEIAKICADFITDKISKNSVQDFEISIE